MLYNIHKHNIVTDVKNIALKCIIYFIHIIKNI